MHPNKLDTEDIDEMVWKAFIYAERLDGGCPYTIKAFAPEVWQLIGHIRRLQETTRLQTAFAKAFPDEDGEGG